MYPGLLCEKHHTRIRKVCQSLQERGTGRGRSKERSVGTVNGGRGSTERFAVACGSGLLLDGSYLSHPYHFQGVIAQLGEQQTEVLKVPRSIRGHAMPHSWQIIFAGIPIRPNICPSADLIRRSITAECDDVFRGAFRPFTSDRAPHRTPLAPLRHLGLRVCFFCGLLSSPHSLG